MTKNFYDLLVGIITAIEGLADCIFVYLGATGTIDAKSVAAYGGSVTIIGNAVLAVCARFIKDSDKKE